MEDEGAKVFDHKHRAPADLRAWGVKLKVNEKITLRVNILGAYSHLDL